MGHSAGHAVFFFFVIPFPLTCNAPEGVNYVVINTGDIGNMKKEKNEIWENETLAEE